jgi:hypothetical protein
MGENPMPEFQMETFGTVQVDPAGRPIEWRDLDEFICGYIEAMFWTNSGDAEDELSDAHGFDDLAGETLAAIIQDCVGFQQQNRRNIEMACALLNYTDARAGHDFWLTRNGHGAGFWDRGLGAVGDALSEAAQVCGERNVYLGDDGAIYLT